MNVHDKKVVPGRGVWMTGDDCSIDEFRALVEQTATKAQYPLADEIQRNVPIYDSARVRKAAGDK